jgi:glycerol uptake facilitator-like aquaporin
MPSLLRRSLAEALGTFALVFIGVGSVASSHYPDANYGVLGIAVAHAIVLAVMITATMAISGGHLNPAVTVGLLTGRRIDARTAGAYIVAQLAGAVIPRTPCGRSPSAPLAWRTTSSSRRAS